MGTLPLSIGESLEGSQIRPSLAQHYASADASFLKVLNEREESKAGWSAVRREVTAAERQLSVKWNKSVADLQKEKSCQGCICSGW